MRTPVVLLLAILVSGCSADSGSTGTEGGAISATSTQGIIRGLVLDDAIRPIGGANVTVEPGTVTTRTGADGAFIVGPLEAGLYTVNVSKPGYHPLVLGVTVLAAIDEPEIVSFQLDADARAQVFYQLIHWSGFIQCGVGTPVPGYSPMACNAVSGAQNEDHTVLPMVPTFVQTELSWESTQALNNELQVVHRGDGGVYAKAEGTDPLVLRVTSDLLLENMPDDLDLITDVFVTNSDPDLVVNQDFDVYTTVFYNFVPPEEWTFLEHGEPEVPA